MRRITLIVSTIILTSVAVPGPAVYGGNGSVTYTYDALGRVTSMSYDTNVLVYYFYDANGNRTNQVVNTNTQSLCLGTSVHTPPNPTTWGAGLWSTAASGC